MYAMILLFADDIKMCMEISSLEDSRCLRSDIDNVLQWSQENKLPFNPKKCQVISIRRTRNFQSASYVRGNHEIERKEEVRDLGLNVDH